MVVVIVSPGFDQPTGLAERTEQRLVQQLVAQPNLTSSLSAACATLLRCSPYVTSVTDLSRNSPYFVFRMSV